MNIPHPLQSVKDQYDRLCAERDAVYAQVQPLEDELAFVNAQIEALRARQMSLAEKIENAWGGAAWLSKKKEIGILAKALSAPGGLLSK